MIRWFHRYSARKEWAMAERCAEAATEMRLLILETEGDQRLEVITVGAALMARMQKHINRAIVHAKRGYQ